MMSPDGKTVRFINNSPLQDKRIQMFECNTIYNVLEFGALHFHFAILHLSKSCF